MSMHGSPEQKTALFGSGGFVGSAIHRTLREEAWTVQALRAPRLQTKLRRPTDLAAEYAHHSDIVDQLANDLDGVDVVVNAAGLARPTGRDLDALYGANALFPGLLALACRRVGIGRLVHISSAAVQGGASTLDESDSYQAVSPYARSKSLGEEALLAFKVNGFTMLRPGSVHGPGRATTRSLARFARGPLSSVAAPGTAPTPQVLVDNVAAAAVYLCASPEPPPAIVLQSSEGWTTSSFLHCLSGRWPIQLPPPLCRRTLKVVASLAGRLPVLAGHHRRLELLWVGQPQTDGWLESSGFVPPCGRGAWDRLSNDLRGLE